MEGLGFKVFGIIWGILEKLPNNPIGLQKDFWRLFLPPSSLGDGSLGTRDVVETTVHHMGAFK